MTKQQAKQIAECQATDSYRKLREMLNSLGYIRNWESVAPTESNPSILEHWVGARIFIAQIWQDGSIFLYASDDVPTNWNDLANWLNPAETSNSQR